MLNRINIVKFKESEQLKFPNTTLTELLRDQPDTMSAEEFLANIATWLSIARIKDRGEKS